MDVLLENVKCLLNITLFSIVFQTTKIIDMRNICLDFMQVSIYLQYYHQKFLVSTLYGPRTCIV